MLDRQQKKDSHSQLTPSISTSTCRNLTAKAFFARGTVNKNKTKKYMKNLLSTVLNDQLF
jgi:hypothetical protein